MNQPKDISLEEENLLKPIRESEMDDSQGLFSLSPDKDKFDSKYFENQCQFEEQKLREVQELNFELKNIEADIDRSDVVKLKKEVVNLVKETKLMFKVMDKILPRRGHDAISTLLEFDEKYTYSNVEEELEDFIRDDEDKETSLSRTLKEIRTLKQNIVKLREWMFNKM